MSKLLLLGAFGAGYVLGARAGRERYDQIVSTAQKVRNDPRVQDAASKAADVAKEQAPVVKDKVSEAAGAAASTAKHAATGGSGGSAKPEERFDTELNPDSTIYQEHPYPQGDLP